ncbi:polysaccharide pyruvyl transferase family protein [Halomonas ramblicola]|uniref:polysaccharide pyruvyl transferase family protein n=1 Tax=Halomonas ramblicola TaxID=747349 RepID=UPI0025B33F0B|nr:polysaccharide pyruvyl transferase family protein [Halomonas ramblicola]MDN3522072.1 polysaccharide pyruvyl transferase family protein [Halomonas ramblicola]
MELKTYYWYHRIVPNWKLKLRHIVFRDSHKYFAIGNAGDIFAKDIIQRRYGVTPVNANSIDGGRLLLIGSVSHRVQHGDILCGIGTQGKAAELPKKNNVKILGLRGPITYDEFRGKGYDLSRVRFLLDPGLLVRFMYQDDTIQPETGSVAFIPHYKERGHYRKLPKSIRLIDIDDYPSNVCRQIQEVEHVFSSSLHGVIFAHALGRPATLVTPKTESLLKYKDYYASVGLDFPVPLREFNGNEMSGLKTSPEHLVYREEDFAFPDLNTLVAQGVVG